MPDPLHFPGVSGYEDQEKGSLPAIASLIPPPIYFSQVPVGVAVGQNTSPSLSQLKIAGLGLRKPPEWEVERKKSKGREASQEMPGCSGCTSRDSW